MSNVEGKKGRHQFPLSSGERAGVRADWRPKLNLIVGCQPAVTLTLSPGEREFAECRLRQLENYRRQLCNDH